MYSKISIYCLLIGLISQIIATPNTFDESTASDEYLSAPVVDDWETINNQNNFEDVTNTFETLETFESDDAKHYGRISAYIEKCLNRETTSVYDIETIHDHVVQAMHPGESLSLDEIKIRVNAIFIDIVDKQNETYEFEESIRQATETFVSMISAAKESELHETVRIITRATNEIMAVTKNDSTGRNRSLILSMNLKIVIASLLRENLSMTTYFLDFFRNVIQEINISEGSNNFFDLFGRLEPILEQTKRNITNAQAFIGDELVNASTSVLKKLSEEMLFIARVDMVEPHKFGGSRCMMEDAVTRIFEEAFIMKFRSAIDPESNREF